MRCFCQLLAGATILLCLASGAWGSARVIGGREVDDATYTSRWSSIVALTPTGWPAIRGQYCAGTLISQTLVVTAAHCVHSASSQGGRLVASQIQIVSGSALLGIEPVGARQNVAQVYVHPGYVPTSPDYDMAVLRLAGPALGLPVPYASSTGQIMAGTIASIAGWGAMSADQYARFPDRLQAAEIPIIDHAACAQGYAAHGSVVTDRMLCAGVLDTAQAPLTSGVDTCAGDSGGPLMVGDGLARQLAGITSWGEQCAGRELGGVYTSVPALSSWLGLIGPVGGPGGLGAPRNVHVAGLRSHGVDLVWDAPAVGMAAGYEISVMAGAAVTEHSVLRSAGSSIATSATVRDLLPGDRYLIAIQARSGDGSLGDMSELLGVRAPRDHVRPSRPGSPRLLRTGASQLVVRWRRSSDDIEVAGYLVRCRLAGRPWRGCGFSSRPAFAVTHLSRRSTYQLRILAVDSTGNRSVPSKTLTARTR